MMEEVATPPPQINRQDKMANWGNIEKQTTNNNIETVDDKDLPRHETEDINHLKVQPAAGFVTPHGRISSVKEDGKNYFSPCPSVSPILHRNQAYDTSQLDGSIFYTSKGNTVDQTEAPPVERVRSPPWRWLLNVSGGLALIAPIGLLAIKNSLIGILVSCFTLLVSITSLVTALVKMRRYGYSEVEGGNMTKICPPHTRMIDTIIEESETGSSEQHRTASTYSSQQNSQNKT